MWLACPLAPLAPTGFLLFLLLPLLLAILLKTSTTHRDMHENVCVTSGQAMMSHFTFLLDAEPPRLGGRSFSCRYKARESGQASR